MPQCDWFSAVLATGEDLVTVRCPNTAIERWNRRIPSLDEPLPVAEVRYYCKDHSLCGKARSEAAMKRGLNLQQNQEAIRANFEMEELKVEQPESSLPTGGRTES